MFSIKFFCILGVASVSVQAIEFQIKNNEGGQVWIGIQGNPGHQHLRNGGFSLGPRQQVSVYAPDNWAGRFWARTFCDPNTRHCLTGDCGNRYECAGAGGNPPASLAEITLKGHEGLDFYDISLVDGFNLKVSMAPLGGQSDGGRYSCKRAGCDNPINNHCPGELQLKGPNNWVIGCKSACLAFNSDQYCCRGAHAFPWTCRASDWPRNYPAMFKGWCPDAYSYAYDDHKSTFTCRNVPVYRIEFGG
ncbi:pathogenesis-related protein 5-like [Harmonia axyridis]|uniref:pathogenesis-related protein 5-like n=1 Tax=Harmonia axyridis TaxID=115357 RepID=UPI001E278A30|nr:pathogenesis-related protein 5-like [Harmonia axyridis]